MSGVNYDYLGDSGKECEMATDPNVGSVTGATSELGPSVGMRCPMSTGRGLSMKLDEDEEFYHKSLKEKEETWFEEAHQQFSHLKWYQRPTKKVLYLLMTIHSLTHTILMGPLVILMLQSICTDETKPMVHHHTGGGMKMGGNSSSRTGGGMNMGGSKLFARMDMGGGENNAIPGCKNKDSQLVLSNVQSVLSFISGILGFLLSGKFGQLSDQYGRVYVFKIFSLINLTHSLCVVIYFHFFKTYHQFLMIVFLSVGYLSGGVMSLISNGNSYLNDLVKAEDRTVSISIMMSLIYSTLGAGPLLGSFIVKASHNNNMTPVYVSIALASVSTLLTFTILKESRHPEAMALACELYARKSNASIHTNPAINFFLNLKQSIVSFFRPMKRLWLPRTSSGSIAPRVNVLTLVFIDNFNMAATIGTMSPMILFSIWKYSWTSVEIGYYMSIGGFGKTIVLLAIAPAFVRFLQRKLGYAIDPFCVDRVDIISVFFSLVFVFLSLLIVIALNNSSGVYMSSVLQSLSGMVSPVTQSAIAKYSSKTAAGEMFGAIALIRHLGMLFFPIIFLQIYSHTIQFSAKFFLYVPLVVSVVTIFVSIFGLKSNKPQEDRESGEGVPLEGPY